MKLQAEALKKNYFRQGRGTNYFTAVQETELTLAPGTVTAVTGRSGSGKTTLLNMLAGLLTPDGGRVLADGEDIHAMNDAALSRFRNAHFGVIPQGQTAVGSLTVLENVLLPQTMYGAASDEARAKALLEELGLGALTNEMPRSLSGGELRRMAIARALIARPGVIFADEPTGDLDDENTRLALALLTRAAAEGAAVLMVTHDAGAAAAASLRYRMDAGVLTAETAGQ